MFPGKVGCFEVITYPFLLAPGGGFFKTLILSCGLESSGFVGTKVFGERLLLSKVDFSKDVVEFETDFSVETLVLDSVMKEDGEAETVFVVEDVVEFDDNVEVELFTNFEDVVVDPLEDFGEGELLLGEECWGLFVAFGPDGLFGAGLGWPLVDGLGEEAGLVGFGRDITADAGFGGINFEFTDDGFGDSDNGLGDIDFVVDNGEVKCFVEAGFEDACFGVGVEEADLVELDTCFAFAPLASFSSTPMCLTKLGVTGFRPVLLRVVRYGRFSEPFRPRITGFGLS